MHSHALVFIQDLAIIMLTAGLATILCRQLKQPMVLGYIAVGILLGPYTPPFSYISDETTIQTLAELGVIFLLFSLGLEFNLQKLSKVGKTAVIAAALEIVLMVWLGYELGILFGWSHLNAIFLGAILSISSTTIIVKTLHELGIKKETFSQIIFGILVVEDIFAILIIALLSSLAITGSLQLKELAITTTKLLTFLVLSFLIGILTIPKLIAYIAKFKSNEVLLVSVLGLCFGFCLLVIKLNYSAALGAFIIGAIIAESKQITKIEHLINPLRDMFSAIFFVSVGLLFNPQVLFQYFIPIVIITLVVIIGKIISCSLGILITGHDGKTSMKVGISLAQIGEFSFIIASLGISLNVTGSFLYSIAVCISIITTLTTPYLIKYSDHLANGIAKIIPYRFSSTFQVYIEWLQSIRPTDNIQLKKAINRSILQIILDLCIVIAIFIVGTYVANTEPGNVLVKITNLHLQKTIIWATALLVSTPFLIAAYRKIKALSMILAELSLGIHDDNRLTHQIRVIIAEVIPITAILIIMALISLLSTSILPPIELLFLVLIFMGIVIAFVWPWFVKLHTRLQTRLMSAIKKDQEN